MTRVFKLIARNQSQWEFKPMNKKTFPQLLDERIKQDKDLNRTKLAKAAGLDKSTIRQMIEMNKSPRMETAEKICKALGTTVEEFMAQGSTEEEQRIAYLVSQIPAEMRLRVLGFSEALHDEHLEAQRQSAQDDQ